MRTLTVTIHDNGYTLLEEWDGIRRSSVFETKDGERLLKMVKGHMDTIVDYPVFERNDRTTAQ